mgnify:FL=1
MDSLPTFDHDDEQALLDSVRKYSSGRIEITHATTYAQYMIDAEKELVKLAKDKDESINVNRYRNIVYLIRNEIVIKHYFPLSRFSPYVELCFRISAEDKDKIEHDFYTQQDKQKILEKLRQDLRSEYFIKTIENKKKAISKNKQSLLRYISDLFEYRSRLLVIRVDLGYSKIERLHKFRPRRDKKISLSPPPKLKIFEGWQLFGDAAREHRVSLIKQVGKQFKKNFIGYVWKLEYGTDKGFHYHMIFFLDGANCRKDITIAQSIGELWKNEIVQGDDGVYWNLNADKKRFEKNNCVATGMISSNDRATRNNLERMATYLVKPDYFVRTALPNGARTFGKGGKPTKNKIGRPRLF